MHEVTAENAADYLHTTGRVPAGAAVAVRALGWGVSNVVLRVDVEGQPPVVLKQARERLRTQALWVSRLDRIWTEHAALQCLAPLLPRGTVPEIVFTDRDNYLFAMTCAPDDSIVWKERLLAGPGPGSEREVAVARQAGAILGTIHAATVDHPALQSGPLSDTVVFDQLRIDPFYRTIARVHPDLAGPLGPLIAPPGPETLPHRCFVHADFSPKNILVHAQGLTLVDFETAHAGDPAYDLGFVLSHLLLKAARATSPAAPAPDGTLVDALLDAYHEHARSALAPLSPQGQRTADNGPGALDRRAAAHAAACALARIDGKSPVDYLDAPRQDAVRRFARAALLEPVTTCSRLIPRLAQEVHLGTD
jgi:5-methylthioribose kinase